MASARRWRRDDRADATLIRRTATFLRDDPGRAGVTCAEDAHALAVLLEILATELPHLDPGVRSRTVESCRAVLGDPTVDPRRGRSRRG